ATRPRPQFCHQRPRPPARYSDDTAPAALGTVDGNGRWAATRSSLQRRREEQMRTSTYPRGLVTGARGVVSHRLVTALKQRGYWVRGVDTSPPEYTVGDADEFELRDLR